MTASLLEYDHTSSVRDVIIDKRLLWSVSIQLTAKRKHFFFIKGTKNQASFTAILQNNKGVFK